MAAPFDEKEKYDQGGVAQIQPVLSPGKEEQGFHDAGEPKQTRRHLTSRHISFIGFGGGIGVGLFVGTGAALSKAGPLGLLLAFIITGFVLFGVIQAAGEMAALFPSHLGFPGFATRFADPALGFALGWNYLIGTALAIASETTACAIIISYWSDKPAALWIGILLIPILALNMVGVKYYGESEVITASMKVITIIGLIILGIILDLGGGPNKDRIGFRHWKNPGAMNVYPGVGDGALARFLAFFSAFINSAFSYSGTEVVVLTAGEATNPSKQIPKVARRVMYRITIFYVLGVFIIGLLVPYTEPRLLGGTGNAASSPWVIAIETAGIKVLPSIINAAILTSAWSAGNTYCYVASRMLYSLAMEGQAPAIFRKTAKSGVPMYAVLFSWAFGLLGFMSAGKGGAATAFSWIQALLGLSSQISWAAICVSFYGFYRACKAQGIDRNTLPMKSPFQPYFAIGSAITCVIVVIFSGFGVFIKGNWNISDFFSNYLSIIVFIVPFVAWKLIKKSSIVKPSEADLWTGRIDPNDEVDEMLSANKFGRFLDKIL